MVAMQDPVKATPSRTTEETEELRHEASLQREAQGVLQFFYGNVAI